ncbi:hypothetical protein MI149_10340 [Mycolicibacterium crocinum]|uniref:Secreted peptide n=1 Tax=Mycolicibacterium crocinum TaxID=388459 RepID=A0ABY3TQ51_9MYCO|nr:hypothetical protein [Mycolicibacterium crocinum]ULN43423.1 hypothetical protein MI149_10340 [Mycolicibacterium crocinum]
MRGCWTGAAATVVVAFVEVDVLVVVSVGVVSALPPQPAADTIATPITMPHALLRITPCLPQRTGRVLVFAP